MWLWSRRGSPSRGEVLSAAAEHQGVALLHLHEVGALGVRPRKSQRPKWVPPPQHLHLLDVFMSGVLGPRPDGDDGGDLVAGYHELVVGDHAVADLWAVGGL